MSAPTQQPGSLTPPPHPSPQLPKNGLGTAESPLKSGESVIRVPVTLTNNGQEEWSPVFTSFGGTLDGAPVQESMGEGDWMYSTPLAPGASVTLTKVFLAGPGDFTLTVSTPHGVAFFRGQA